MCDFASTADSRGHGFRLERAYVRRRHAAVQLGIRTGGLEISPSEPGDGDRADEHEIRDGPEPQRDAALLRAAERAESQQEPGETGCLLRDRAQRVLVERLERNRPGGDLRSMNQPRRVENMPDVPEEPGDQA